MIVGQTNHKKIQAIKISAINKNAKIFIILYFLFLFWLYISPPMTINNIINKQVIPIICVILFF